jgi:hypothetical protein
MLRLSTTSQKLPSFTCGIRLPGMASTINSRFTVEFVSERGRCHGRDPATVADPTHTLRIGNQPARNSDSDDWLSSSPMLLTPLSTSTCLSTRRRSASPSSGSRSSA